MKYLKLLLICFSILFLNSCGYTKLNSEKFNNFKINKLEIDGEKNLIYKIKNNIEIYSYQNSKFIYDIKIKLITTKKTKIKNTAGKTTRYSTKIQANALIANTNTKKVYTKTFISTNDYEVGSTHSDTLSNEKNAIQANINYISDEIIKYIKILNI